MMLLSRSGDNAISSDAAAMMIQNAPLLKIPWMSMVLTYDEVWQACFNTLPWKTFLRGSHDHCSVSALRRLL
jgi:hypothetical protein